MKKENIILGSTHISGLLLVLFFISTQFFGCGGDEPEEKPVQKEVVQQQEQKKPEPKPKPKQEQQVIRRDVPPGLEPDFIGEFYIVQPDDNLNDLARRYYGRWENWREIFHANEHKIDDWNVLTPGMRIEIPPLNKEKR
ncbi:MAG: hypothetical protein SCALA702_23740 [Melioribacteraceae bacterium]|nr:MAG: hypothetical protein SCALA702_23740 [Melioribacteraceae bacterium]